MSSESEDTVEVTEAETTWLGPAVFGAVLVALAVFFWWFLRA